MERIYRKVGRKYVDCGYNNIPDISDGVWLVQGKQGSKSHSSVFWKVGNLERPSDITTHAAIQSLTDDVAQYLMNLCKWNSKEFEEAKELCGGYLKDAPAFLNISAADLVKLLLRRVSLHLEDGENLSWDSLQYKFREETQLHLKPEFQEGVKVLYMFTDWLKKNNVKFRQGKNIG